MITRTINGVETDIEESLPNELYFTQEFIDSIPEFSGDTDQIKNGIYGWKAANTYLPLSVMWELTNSCVFSCPFCYINTPKAKRHPFYSLSELKTITDSLVEMGMLFCTVSGGECLMHPDFAEFYRYLKKKGVIVSVFTNGYLLDEKLLAVFKEYMPYKIEISIYGITQAGFKAATNSDLDYSVVLNNILALKEMGIDVRCKTPITSVTSSEIPEIRAWCQKNDIFYYVSDELFDSYYGEKVDEYRADDAVFQAAVKAKEDGFKRNSNHEFGRKKAWDCSAGKYTGVISADRCFYPCMASVGLQSYRYSMADGIAEAVRRFRQTLREESGKPLDFCSGCNSCDVCEKCVLSLITDTDLQLSEHCKYMEQFG